MSRSFDLWGVPFDGGAALGWPGARYAPDRVRRALSWMLMREEDGMVRVVDVGQDLPMPEIEDRGDVEVVPHDLVATIDATSEAVEESVRTGGSPSSSEARTRSSSPRSEASTTRWTARWA